MEGRRIFPNEGGSIIFNSGNYGIAGDGNWHACTPNGHVGNLANHDVVEHEDGTITVSPSILVTTTVDGQEKEVWHGYLERGVWREV